MGKYALHIVIRLSRYIRLWQNLCQLLVFLSSHMCTVHVHMNIFLHLFVHMNIFLHLFFDSVNYSSH